MRFLFVWPNKDQYGFKPIGISLLSSILKSKGHKVDLFDTTFIDLGYKSNQEIKSRMQVFKPLDTSDYKLNKSDNLEKELISKLESFKPNIVGISALSDELSIGLKISSIIKGYDKSIIILYGNKSATMNYDNIISNENVDYVCRGEGIIFIQELVDAIDSKRSVTNLNNLIYKVGKDMKINRLNPLYQNLDDLPYLDWEIYDNRHFLKPYEGKLETGGDHMITWGCPNSCTYCINHAYRKLYRGKGKYIRSYSVERMIEELEYLKKKWNITFLKFHDEDFCLKDEEYLKELSNKYSDRVNIPFTIMVNAKRVNENKVKMLKNMNCKSVTIGIETGNQKLRRDILNRYETQDDIIYASKLFNHHKIRTSSFNMLGIPFETRDTIMETVELNRLAEIEVPNTTFFYPLKDTKLRDISIENNFIPDDFSYEYKQGEPSLDLNTITKKELISIRERFLLYIKLPKSFYNLIRKSEEDNECGKYITKELFKIYNDNYREK